jgi:hypothetical protein
MAATDFFMTTPSMIFISSTSHSTADPIGIDDRQFQ